MKNNFIKTAMVLFLLIFLITSVFPINSFAGRTPNYPERGFKHVPPGSHRIRHKNAQYIFHGGRYYKPGRDGYVFVRPPAGIIVNGLPAAAAVVLIAGITYYVFDNIYYKKVPRGYQVVEVPGESSVNSDSEDVYTPWAAGSQVQVRTNILNVRSGPGANHSILSQTYSGDLLIIQGNSPQWIYVLLPDGTHGWVMKKFVSIPESGAKG